MIVKKGEGFNILRDNRRQIPALAADSNHQLDMLHAEARNLLESNNILQGKIVCLEEEKKAQKLIGMIEDERMKKNEFEVKQLTERLQELHEEHEGFLERGE